jgi:hypothetical protein
VLQWDKISQNGKTEHKKHNSKLSQNGKEAVRNGWEYDTDGQNVDNQVKEGGHYFTIDKTSTLR